MDLSYCVVNTGGRDLLMACLDAIDATKPPELETEVLVLDNASQDGSAQAVRERGGARLIALDRREGKAANDSRLLREARGRHCLLLNEDSELRPGAARALVRALDADPRAAAAGAQLLSSGGVAEPCAWRLPDLTAAVAFLVGLQERVSVQSRGTHVREVGWTQSSAMLVRRAAAEGVGFLDPEFFVYSDETDFCKRLSDAGWRILFVPAARAVHHDQLNTDLAATRRRLVEFHRGRDRYLRKHGSTPLRLAVRSLWTVGYLVRAAAAVAIPGRDPRRYLLHASQELRPWRGAGIREAAEAHNRRLGAAAGGAGSRAE